MSTLELLLIGGIVGYILNPIGQAITAICRNAWAEYRKGKDND